VDANLKAYLNETLPPAEFAIYYHIGDDFSGETDLRLRGDGDCKLESTVTQGRQRKTYHGHVPPNRVAVVVRKLQESCIWEVRHVHPRPGEDDPEAIIAVEAAGKRDQVVLWVSEIGECPPFAKAQAPLLALVHELSKGEVLESGQ